MTAELIIVKRDVLQVLGAKLQQGVLMGFSREAARWKFNGTVCQPNTYRVLQWRTPSIGFSSHSNLTLWPCSWTFKT